MAILNLNFLLYIPLGPQALFWEEASLILGLELLVLATSGFQIENSAKVHICAQPLFQMLIEVLIA